MNAMPFAPQAAINAMIVGRFTVVRFYAFILSAPGDRLDSKSRSSFSALRKFIGLLLFPPARKS